jgi:hypothetical protein
MIALATFLPSWPVTTRRIGGNFAGSVLMMALVAGFSVAKSVPQRRRRVTMARR